MSFKFLVGEAVEYTPIGEKAAGLYRILRQMPDEDGAPDLRYRIKSESEAHERNVPEGMLTPGVVAEAEYALARKRILSIVDQVPKRKDQVAN